MPGTKHNIEAMIEKVNLAITALKQGKPVVMIDDEDRENEGDLILAAQFATPENVNFMIKEARGLVCAPITEKAAKRLNLLPMHFDNQDPHKTAFTVSVDFHTTKTGISAYERSLTLKALSDPTSVESDFNKPGHIFPLVAKEGGVLERRGHTEASIDLMKLAKLEPVAVICEILKDDGEMARNDDLAIFCQKYGLCFLTMTDLVEYRRYYLNIQENQKDSVKAIEAITEANLPTQFGQFKIQLFPNIQANGSSEPHVALIKKGTLEAIQDNPKQTVLVRVHSECLTGDIFGSKKCDCQPQLHFGLNEIGHSDLPGVLIYLRQEGRGIGLVEKIKAYALQDQGQDTIEANLSLGHKVDQREFKIAADILKSLGIFNITLITNNPEKQKSLIHNGINITSVRKTPKFETEENKNYLQIKIEKMHHTI